MFKKIAYTLFLLTAVSLAACSPMSASAPERSIEMEEDFAAMPMESEKEVYYDEYSAEAPGSGYSDGSSDPDDSGVSNVLQSPGERIVIKNADLSIVVDDPGSSMEKITKMAEEMGGFVVDSYLYKTTTNNGVEVPEATITVRIPADQLTDALEEIKGLVNNPKEDILSENISGQDVTKEYTDLKSRLRNLEEAETKLIEIMDEAYNTEDVLSVYYELERIGADIEVIKGQIQYYEEASALSAISIQILAHESVAPLTIGKWQPAGDARDAVQALINAVEFFATAAIWITIFFIPVLLIIAVPFVLIFLGVRFIVRKRKAARVLNNTEEKKAIEEKEVSSQ